MPGSLLPPPYFSVETDPGGRGRGRMECLYCLSMVCLPMLSVEVDVYSVFTESKGFPEPKRNKTVKRESIGTKYRWTEVV